MLEFANIRRFIHSSKKLKHYVAKLKSADLINLLDELDQLKSSSKKRKNDKNPVIRKLKCNLIDQDYLTLMNKLKIYSHQEQAFSLTKKEIVLHFIGVLSAILFGSFSGFVGLLTALGMVFSIEILGVLIVAVFAISLIIALIWNYQIRINAQESIENQKVLNFELEVLKIYNLNKINKLLNQINGLKLNLGLETEEIDLNALKEGGIIEAISCSLNEINEAMENLKSKKQSLQASQVMEDDKTQWIQSLTALKFILKQKNKNINRAFTMIKHADNLMDNPKFFHWFKNNTSHILVNVFNESKNLLANVALATVLGLVTLKLIAQTALVTTLLTTYAGVGILVGVIIFVILISLMGSLYAMYKKYNRRDIKQNILSIIEQEKQIKDQLEAAGEQLDLLSSLVATKKDSRTIKVHDTVFMGDLVSENDQKNKLNVLKTLFDKKNLSYTSDINQLLNENPLLIIKIIKKITDNIISNDEELEKFLEDKLNSHKIIRSEKLKYVHRQSSPDEERAFNLAKFNLSNISHHNLLLAVAFIENQASFPEKAYTFAQQNFQLIQNIAAEIAKRLSAPDISVKERKNLRQALENYKNMRKKVACILVEENKKLRNSFKDYIDVLAEQGPQEEKQNKQKLSRTLAEDPEVILNNPYVAEYNNMEEIKKSLEYDTYTGTIFELTEKKLTAAKNFKENSSVAKEREKNYFNFWQPYRENQKVANTFAQIGINLKFNSR